MALKLKIARLFSVMWIKISQVPLWRLPTIRFCIFFASRSSLACFLSWILAAPHQFPLSSCGYSFVCMQRAALREQVQQKQTDPSPHRCWWPCSTAVSCLKWKTWDEKHPAASTKGTCVALSVGDNSSCGGWAVCCDEGRWGIFTAELSSASWQFLCPKSCENCISL